MAESTFNPDKKRSRLADIAKLIVFLGIGFLFIYLFLIKLDSGQKEAIWQAFIHADYTWVGAAMLVCVLSHLVRALRWQLLYQPIGYAPSLNNTFGSVMVAYMANIAFPRLGEVMRCATMRTSEKIPVEKSLGTVVTERTIDVLSFGLIVVVGMLAMYGQAKEWLYGVLAEKSQGLPHLAILAAILLAVGVGAIVVYSRCRQRWIKNKVFAKIDNIVQGGLDGLKSIFYLGTKKMLLFVVYSVIIYLLYIFGGVLILKAFPETHALGFGAAFVLYIFGSVGMTISQGGLGAYPVLVWQALALYGISETVGLAAGWLLWSSQQIIVIAIGLAYLVYFSLAKKRNNIEAV